MKTQKGFTIVERLSVIVILAGFGGCGWIANIVKIVGIVSDPITGMFILRCIGIFVPPVGAVLGFV